MTKHDGQVKSEDVEEVVSLLLDGIPFAFRDAISNILNNMKFWVWAVVLFLFSVVFVEFILYFTNSSYVLGDYGTPLFENPISIGGYFTFKSHSYNKEILSTIAQIEATILGVWFALIFLGYSIQISNKAGSPHQIKRHLSSRPFIFVFLVFIITLAMNVVMIRYADLELDLFWLLSLSVYAILLIPMYIYNTLISLSNTVIREEVLGKNARYDLKGSNLSLMDLSKFNLCNRDLTKCDLRFSNLSETNLNSAVFHRTNLKHARLNGANLVRARLTKTNLEGTNFGGADLNMAAFGMNEDLLKVSRAIVILHITANNFLFQRIIYDRIKQRFIMIDNEYESDDEKISKLLIEFVLLINSSRLARLSLKLMRILFNLIGPKASHLDVTYDEITINSLLNAKNLDKAEFYGPIKRDLIDRSRDIVNDPDTDLELKESLKNFLASSDVDENQTANELNL